MADGRKPMTVIGAVKKNKMQPFYKEEPDVADESSNYFGGGDKEGFGGQQPSQQVPYGGMYNQMMSPGGSPGHPLAQRQGGVPPPGGRVPPRSVQGMSMRGMPSMPAGTDSMGHNSGGMPPMRNVQGFMPGMRQGAYGHAGDRPVQGSSGAGAIPGGNAGQRGERRLSLSGMPDASDFPSLGSADQFPSLGGNGNRSVPGPTTTNGPNSSGLQSSAATRSPALGSGLLGMPFGQGSLAYNGKKGNGKREGFNAMSEDMFPSLPGAKASGKPESHGPASESEGASGEAGTNVKQVTGLNVDDRYRLIGLLPIVRNPSIDLKMLALGVDLTTLGLNLNSPDVLFPSFESPWADAPLAAKPKDPPFSLPPCYALKANLPPVTMRLQSVSDDTLFFVFYGMPGDLAQLAAAVILYERHWRYHKEQKIWITRAPGVEPSQKTNTFERGTYIYFDHVQWKKVTKEFVLQYDQLEERKTLPPPS